MCVSVFPSGLRPCLTGLRGLEVCMHLPCSHAARVLVVVLVVAPARHEEARVERVEFRVAGAVADAQLEASHGLGVFLLRGIQ